MNSVFGRAVANRIGSIAKPGESQAELPKNAGEESIARLDAVRYANGTEPTAAVRLEMQKVCLHSLQ